MATRRDIRDAFYDELETGAIKSHTVSYGDGTTDQLSVGSDDISLQFPEDTEAYPHIIYNDNYRLLEYNGVGAGPDWVERDSSGRVVEERWREYIEGQFLVQVRAQNDIEKEPIYESIRTQFAQYKFGPWDPTDVHNHIIDINVRDSQSADVGDVEDRIRGDTIEVRVKFFREYTFSTDNIDQINLEVDADLDSQTSGFIYTVP